MRQYVRLLLPVLIALTLAGGEAPYYARATQPQTQRQPGPGKKFVTTPFGPIEVDITDPREGIAFGPPLEQQPPANPAAAQPQPATAQPQPATAQPAQTQPAPQTQPAQQPGQPAQPVQQEADQVVPVKLVFDNQDLHSVVRIIAQNLGINYIIDPTVRGTVNVETYGAEVRRSDLFGILEAILKVNGATMVRSGNFYQIVPAGAAVRMPLEVQITPARSLDDQVILQIVPMKFVAADEMARL